MHTENLPTARRWEQSGHSMSKFMAARRAFIASLRLIFKWAVTIVEGLYFFDSLKGHGRYHIAAGLDVADGKGVAQILLGHGIYPKNLVYRISNQTTLK